MMLNLEKHPFFEKYTDPKSGTVSYILNNKPTPVVQGFYFVNQSLSEDQRHLWVYCANPPLPLHSLAVIGMDGEKPFVRHFPHAVFGTGMASPLVSKDGESVYFASGSGIYQVFSDGHLETFALLPEDYIQNRKVYRIATHLTISADKKYMLLDGQVGAEWFVATIDMKTREVKILHTFPACYNHAQFSPTDPDLFLIDEDGYNDPITGKKIMPNNRMWLMDVKHTMHEAIDNGAWCGVNSSYSHDFWSQDGYICWVDYDRGTFEMNVKTKEITHVWKTPVCHSHANADRSLWVADESPYWWNERPCKVMLYNRASDKSTEIFSAMPKPRHSRMPWHLDPHPQFTSDGNYIIGTTTVRGGEIDLFITPVEEVLSR